jgi:hypothetical protein
MAKFIGQEKLSKFSELNVSSARLLNGSYVVIGGQAYNIGQLDINIDTSGFGGLELTKQANTLYYVYAVLENGSPRLIGSVNPNGPIGFLSYRKVGALYLDHRSEIYKGFSVGEQPQEETEVYVDSGDPVTTTQLTTNGNLEQINTLNYLANNDTNGFIIMNANIDVKISASAAWNSTSSTTAVAIYTFRDNTVEKIAGLANATNTTFDESCSAHMVLNGPGDYFYWRALTSNLDDVRLYSTLSGYLFRNIDWSL